MKLELNQQTRIEDLQRQFQQAYPFLKIEFFDKAHPRGSVNRHAHRYDPGFTLKRLGHGTGTLSVQPWLRTGDLEEQFEQIYGLHVQVYRRKGYEWVETAGTDELCLDEQNDLGRESVLRYHEDPWIEREVLL
jgi:hypothetical protein